jgi:hypothetical protein
MFVMPVARLGYWTITQVHNKEVRPIRASVVWLLVLSLLMFVTIAPIPQRLACRGVVEPRSKIPIIAHQDGELQTASNAIEVTKNATLFECESLELELRKEQLRADLASNSHAMMFIQQQMRSNDNAAEFVQWKSSLASEREKLLASEKVLDRYVQRLQVKSPEAGTWIPAIAEPVDTFDPVERAKLAHQQRYWNSMEMRGRHLAAGTLLGWLASTDKPLLVAEVDQIQYRSVTTGMRARIRLHQFPARVYTGRVTRIATEANPSTAQRHQSKMKPRSESGEATNDIDKKYVIEIEMDDLSDGKPLIGGQATIVLHGSSLSIAGRLNEFLARHFR